VSLTGRAPFTGPAARVLLLVGTGAAVLAVQSGTAAHGPVERVPGARAAALAPAVSRWRRWVLAGSALVGVGGAVSLYEAADLGGDLVYNYAGGVGIRSGDPADVGRLLVAGLYHQAMLERKAGKPADAAQLIGQLSQRYPADTGVRLLA